MVAQRLLGAARILIACSAVAALVAHAWLSIGHPWVVELSLGALVAGAAAARLWPRQALWGLLAVGHVWPLLSYFILGTVDALAVMVWVSAITAHAIASAPLARWSLPPRWTLPVAAWGVLLSLGWPIIVARELDFTLVTYMQNATANGMWGGPVRETTAFVVAPTATALAALLIFDWLWAAYGERPVSAFVEDVVVPFTIGTAAALAIGIYQGTVDLAWWSNGVWPGLGRAAGSYFDANAFGSTAALWAAPVAGVAMLAAGGRWRAIGLALMVAAAVAVWASGSRTALAGLIVVLGGTAWALGRAGRFSPVLSAVAALAVATTLAVGWTTGGPGSALHRVWQTLPAASAADVKRVAIEMWTRNGYGSASVAMMQRYPLTGVGPGAYPVMAPGYSLAVTGDLIPPDNAQNWWRHQWTELGIFGGLLPVACSLLVLAAVVGLVRRRNPPVDLVLAAAVAAAGTMSLVSSPSSHPIVYVTMAVMIFWASLSAGARRAVDAGAGVGRGGIPVRRRTSGGGGSALVTLLVVWVVPVIWAAATWWVAVGELRPPYRAERFGWPYGYGFSAPDELPDGGERRWAGEQAVGVVPIRTARLLVTFRAPAIAPGVPPADVRLSTRTDTVCHQRVGVRPVTCKLDFTPGDRWRMVQIDASRDVEVTTKFVRVLADGSTEEISGAPAADDVVPAAPAGDILLSKSAQGSDPMAISARSPLN